jgi:hypothetical protein
MPSPQRPFEDEGVLRTDEQADPATRYQAAEKEFDPAHPPTPLPVNQKTPKARRPTEKDQLETSEREDPSKAVRDAYQDS